MNKFLKQLTLVLVLGAVLVGGKGHHKHNQVEEYKLDLPFWHSLEDEYGIETTKLDLPFWH